MRMSVVRLITGLCLLWMAGCASVPVRTPGEYRISGTLEGVRGGRLPEAEVLLAAWGEGVSKPLLRAPVASDGRFSLATPGPGDYTLWLTAPGYPAQALYLQLLADQPDLNVTARLEPYYYLETLAAPTVVGSWNGFNWRDADSMRPQWDGTWVLDRAVEGERVTYQFQGLISYGHGVSCYPGDGYEPGPQGEYRCRATPRAGRIHLVLDPRQLPRTATLTPLRATFSGAYASLDSINALHARSRSLQGRAWRIAAASEANDAPDFDFGTLPGELLAVARDARQPLPSRQLAVMDLLRLSPFYSLAEKHPGAEGEALAAELLKVLPPDSPRWAMSLEAVAELHKMVNPAGRAALGEDFAQRNPNEGVQAQGLALQLREAHEAKDTARMAQLAERLKPFAQKQYVAHFALQELMPEEPEIDWKDRPVPDFSAPLLGTEERVSRESLLGRFYLIDFWATWCAPCVAEMPVLHAAAAKFKGRGGFTLFSVSMDASPEKVTGFREGTWKMPWGQLFNGPDFKGPLCKDFQIDSLPTTLLVDARGVVVASGEALRGAQLEKTLESLLPASKP